MNPYDVIDFLYSFWCNIDCDESKGRNKALAGALEWARESSVCVFDRVHKIKRKDCDWEDEVVVIINIQLPNCSIHLPNGDIYSANNELKLYRCESFSDALVIAHTLYRCGYQLIEAPLTIDDAIAIEKIIKIAYDLNFDGNLEVFKNVERDTKDYAGLPCH